MLQLFADTDCDITKRNARELGYELISMPYSIGDKLICPYEDWEEFNSHEFYEMLREGTLPKTSSISEEKYIEYFEPVFKNGDDIFYPHFPEVCRELSSAWMRPSKNFLEKYPERKFFEVDLKGISALCLNLLEEISEKAKTGISGEELKEWAEGEVDHFALYFFADDLKFFKQSGRVSNLAGTMGTLLGIRPIIYVDNEGKMLSIGKEKGRFKAAEKLISYVKDLGQDIKDHRIIIASSDNNELVDEIKKRLIEEFGEDLNIETETINPTIGAHCGPDAVGICFYAKHR